MPATVADLLSGGPRVVNLGLEMFAEQLRAAGGSVVHVDWRPPAGGDPAIAWLLADLDAYAERIDAANREAVGRLLDAQPVWTDVGMAGEVIPGLTPTTILHAGPPITWQRMCGPQRGGVMAALIFEGLARNAEEAIAVAESGRVTFAPCHDFGAVGPMAGVISASMPVIVVENRAAGNLAYSTFNGEGRGASHTMGLYDEAAQATLRWVRDILAPAMCAAVRQAGGIDLKAIIARALQMGDEGHNRHVASTSLLTRLLLPHLAQVGTSHADLADIGDFLIRNDWFFLNFSMAACKASADAAAGIPWSTMATAYARNGVEVGLRVSGLDNRWFTAPAPRVEGVYWPGFSEADANPDMGDSAITETCGIGAFALAAAPAMAKVVGGSAADALGYTREMGEITLAENANYGIPHLDFQGTPTGIDIRKVVETGIAPVIDTAIAHREPGKGMIGAGLVRVPLECFVEAVRAFAEEATPLWSPRKQGDGTDAPSPPAGRERVG